MFSVLGVLAAEAVLCLVFVLVAIQLRVRPVAGPVPSDRSADPRDLIAADTLHARRILRGAAVVAVVVFLLLPLLDLHDGRRAWMLSSMLGATTLVWAAAVISTVRPSRLHGTGWAPASVAPRGLRRLVVSDGAVLAALLLLGLASGSAQDRGDHAEPALIALLFLVHPVRTPGFVLWVHILALSGVLLAAWTAVVAVHGIRRSLPRRPAAEDGEPGDDAAATR